MKKEDAVYWIALAHLSKWSNKNINNLIIKFFHENKISIEDFFHLDEDVWRREYQLDEKQVFDLKHAKSNLPNIAFLAESFFSQGYEIIPIISPEYSKKLKINLKVAHSPAVLYIKGDKNILNENSVAIVGSRNASEIALKFTDNIAKLATKEFKVIVSGFAKGVDRQALESAIKYNGKSIIVLPQGLMTFTGYKNYYKQIINGDVLVLSTFHPKAIWRVELAMARNPIIYGLSDEIYIAESSEKGGTWSGAIDGLRKGRIIFVRKPEPNEKNANNLLIEKGGIPVSLTGDQISIKYELKIFEQENIIKEPNVYESLEIKIRESLKNKPLTVKEIKEKLNLNWSTRKLSNFLKKLDFIEIIKEKKKNFYKIKGTKDIIQPTLF